MNNQNLSRAALSEWILELTENRRPPFYYEGAGPSDGPKYPKKTRVQGRALRYPQTQKVEPQPLAQLSLNF